MAGLNRIILIGNLGKDPEMRFTPQGTAVTDFSLAVNDGRETEWFNITAWEKTAELVNQYLSKGSPVCVEGRVGTQKWEGQDGQTKYKTVVTANRVVFLGKGEKKEEREVDGEWEIEPEDLPF